jgi:hypothetical protein
MKRKILIGLGVIILLLIVFLLIYLAYDRSLMPPAPSWSPPPYASETTWEDYARHFVEKNKEPNALEHYLNAFSLFTTNTFLIASYETDSILRYGWTQPYPKAEEALRLNQAAIQEMVLGAKMNQCSFPPRLIGNYPHNYNFLRLQTFAKLLAVNGKKYESLNQPTAALDYYLTGIQFGKDMGLDKETLIGQLISIAMIRINTHPILNLIPQDKLTESDYRKIITELNRIDREQATFADILESDYQWRYILSNPKKYGLNLDSPNQPKRSISRIIGDSWIGIYLYFTRGHVFREKYDRVTTAKTTTYPEFMKIDWQKKMSYRDELPIGYTRVMHEVSFLRLAQVESAIQLYHLEKKQWPKGMDELKSYLSPIPVDPFNDKPFLWTTDSGGKPFAYSVGPDFKDDSAKIVYDPSNGVVSVGDVIPN